MKRISDFISKTCNKVKRINNVLIGISAIAILILNFVVFYDIIMRYIFIKSTVWGTEISTYLILLITFLSAGYTFQVDGHVNCSIVIASIKPRLRRFFFLISAPFGLMFCVILGWEVWRLFYMAYSEGWISNYVLETPLKYPYLLMPAGMFILVLTYLLKAMLVLLKPFEDDSTVSHKA